MIITPIVKQIFSIIIALCMNIGVSNIVSTTPDQAVKDFLGGLKTQQKQVMEKYIDDGYVNFLCNVEGDEKVKDRMRAALFKNFSYDIIEIGEKNDVAVAKVSVKHDNFSNVLAEYEKESYDYIMKNLYAEDISDKEKLNTKCFDIYVSQIEKAASGEGTEESVIYVPMVDDGYYGWNIILQDGLMETMLGGLEIPSGK